MVDHPQLMSDELESLLMMPADERWNVGQRYKPSPSSIEQIYKFSRWSIYETALSLDEMDNSVRLLTDRIQSIEKNFNLLPETSTVSLTLFITDSETVLGIGIDPRTVNLLARIKAGLEISLIIEIPSRL